MLQYILLAAMVASAASDVLRYESNQYRTSINETRMISKEEYSNAYSHSGHSILKVDLAESNTIKCKIIAPNIADCSKKGINDLKELSPLPDSITNLDLSFNNISFIDNHAFFYLPKLEWLNISHNNLQYLNNDSFFGLSNLKELDLHGNNLSMGPQKFPVNVFKPLMTLQTLLIHNNTNVNDTHLNYPHEALAHLQAVEYLQLDGLPNKTLGTGFSYMNALTTLIFRGTDDGHCNIQSLPNNTFENVTGVRHLELVKCVIVGKWVEPGVFLPLGNLTYLDVSQNDALKFEPLGAALKTIRKNTNLKFLKIDNIENPYSPGLCVTNTFAESLPEQLDELNASSNSIETLELGMLQKLPKTLRIIDVSSNKFAFWPYLKELDKLENLHSLILGGAYFYPLPWYYPPDAHRTPNQCKDEVASTTDELYFLHGPHKFLSQRLPPHLKELNASKAGFSNILSEFHFNDSNTLEALRLDSNNFPVVTGPIRGLNHLRSLSMYDCKIKEIYPTFFQFLGSLEFLNLSYNLFGDMALNNTKPLFIHLGNLKVLDLSFTNIWRISSNAFEGLGKLEFLYLQFNTLLKFNVDISHMHSLTFINLTNTNVVSLSNNMTKVLDRIKDDNKNFTIDFSNNNIHCFCSKFKFVKWLKTTNVLSNTTRITCIFEDDFTKTVDSLEDLYVMLQKECASHLEAFSVIIAATFVLILAIIGAIMFRFRWKLRYLYYSAILHYKSHENKNDVEEFEYDVFVSYAHEDHEFVEKTLYDELRKRGFKVLIHGLHFTAGEFITSNIVRAVQTSRRTLVVLTQSLVDSYWSGYEIQMANMEQSYTGRSVLLFLLMGNTPRLPNDIRSHIARNTYIDFPNSQCSERENDLFWSKLASDLRS
ncbi:hypothetical protein BsWGS_12810 [Bradybaena similaris]